ncbi:Transcriptional regulatory protein [Saliniradius amylolyticus]|uniref:Transcriptional regulatory protein n=1 Tax=Saliniradius amylolyticus TaxID=2183582 RepID=A0A2S2E6R4_9ALTE|nr:response regulator transcription factor [Saliniradius amylolyticus]AWL13331.1 Transcriptional regulatory protein [Saliniradius amylolyticus]
MRILLVEDDYPLAQGIKTALKGQGFAVDHLTSGKQALMALQDGDVDAAILDLGLPDMDGVDVLKSLRQKKSPIPVLVLTARDRLDDRVSGLDAGADDYLVKPFEMEELFARLRVIERRLGTASTGIVQIGPVTLDTTAQQVTLQETPIRLSKKEYMLLKILMENAGRFYSREKLETKLYEWGEEVASNAVEVHIHKLRKKLPVDFIQNTRGMGYCIQPA